MTVTTFLRRWSIAALAANLLGRLAGRVLAWNAFRHLDPAETDFGGDDD